MLNKRVRVTKKELKWFLSDAGYNAYTHPWAGKVDSDYDEMVEIMLFMAMFDDEYPGIVESRSGLGTYKVKFDNGYSTWLEKNMMRIK